MLVSSPSDLLAEGETVNPRALPDKKGKGGANTPPATKAAANDATPDTPKTPRG